MSNRIKAIIFIDIIMVIFTMVTAFVTKNTTWVVCSVLWIDLAITNYCDNKLLESKDELFDIQNELIDAQQKTITEFIKQQNSTKIVMLNDIKISKKYKKPGKAKMDSRIEYYKHFQDFRVPVLVDKDNNLKDGYTSYLIAQSLGHNCISVRVV